MNKNIVKGVEDTILSLFDEFSNKHSWYPEMGNNTHYYNGWASNSAFKINKKIITILSAYRSYSNRLDFNYSFFEKLRDVEHVFDYLDGGNTENKDLKEILNQAEKTGQTRNIITKYFKISTFKKGTTHFSFLDDDLLQKFNLFGSQRKGFLPPSYGKAKYTDMTAKEQSVIDEFEGKESYNKVMGNLDYYLYNPSNTLQIEGQKQ